jgi:DNA-binding NarL/FixJ family response regulator
MQPPNDEASPLALPPALVVEDDARARDRLVRLLAALGVADDALEFAADLADARARFAARRFASALVDLELPDGSGIDFIRWMRPREAGVTVVVVSTFATQDLILAALHAGAVGYLLKERDDAELLAALRSVQRGGAPIDPFVARHILRCFGPVAPPANDARDAADDAADRLTRREEEILHLVAQGLISREIAQRLSRSTLTIEGHIKSIFRKLQVNTRTQAIYQARALGLLR